MTQEPILTPEQLAEVVKAEAGHAGASQLARAPLVRRERVMPGETPEQAKARWAREREIERDHGRDPRRTWYGQVLPVFPEG